MRVVNLMPAGLVPQMLEDGGVCHTRESMSLPRYLYFKKVIIHHGGQTKHICGFQSTHGHQGCNSFMEIFSRDPSKKISAAQIAVNLFWSMSFQQF